MNFLCIAGSGRTRPQPRNRRAPTPPRACDDRAREPTSIPRIDARTHRRRVGGLAAGILCALIVTAALSVILGTLRLDPLAALEAIFSPSGDQVSTVVWSIRLPRIIVAMLVGGALAGVGVVMQAVF